MRSSVSLVLILITHVSSAQFDGMDEKQKVEYINKNYYSLYSASLPNALELTRWASETASRNNWKKEEAYAQLNWGIVTYLGGDYVNVLPKYLRALSLFEELGDKTGLIAVNNEMGVFYSRQDDVVNSFRCLDRAEQLARETNDLERLGTNLGNRGAILSKHGKFEEAGPYFLEVYEIRKKTRDSVGLGYVLLDLADMAARDNDLAEAIAFVDESTRIRSRIKDKYGLSENAVRKGEIYESFRKPQDAANWMQQGQQLAEEVGYTDLNHYAHGKLAKLFEQQGDFRSAYGHLQQSSLLKDSLLNTQKIRTIQELQARFETEKKEMKLEEQELKLKQNWYLILFLAVLLVMSGLVVWFWRRQEKASRRREKADRDRLLQEQWTKAVIDLQEAERARIARDVHDGLGQLISSVRMQVNRSAEAWTNQTLTVLDQMHQEIRNIAFALLPHTLVAEGLGPALRELATRVSVAEQFCIHVDEVSSEGRLDAKAEVSLYRVCQEWISNIMKYSGAHNLHINLLIHPDGSGSLSLEDDGAGFDPSILEHGTGNGWRNIRSRLRLHQGSVYVDSSVGRPGTTLVIELPRITHAKQNAA